MRFRSALLGLLCAVGHAQDQPFRAESRAVIVPVSVVTKQGEMVDGLEAKDFVLTDNGVPQRIAVDTFGAGSAPISLVVAIQSAGISAAVLAKLRDVGSTLQPLLTGERGEVAVLTFDTQVRWIQDFTRDPQAMKWSFQGIRYEPGKSGRMLDAVVEAAKKLDQRDGRRVLLIISESRDRGSKTSLAAALKAVERSNIVVYAAKYSAYTTPFTAKPEDLPPPQDMNLIALFTESARLAKHNAVRAFASISGGQDFSFLTHHGLEDVIQRVGQDVHSQYLLSFVPAQEEAPGLHKLQVTVPEHDDVRIRAREGYWSQ